MASFGSLPVELVQKIIHYLIAYDEDAPVIGHNAVDTDVFHWYKAKQASPENRSRYELLQALPKTVEEDDDDENNEDGDTDDLKAENLYPIHSLKQLRL